MRSKVFRFGRLYSGVTSLQDVAVSLNSVKCVRLARGDKSLTPCSTKIKISELLQVCDDRYVTNSRPRKVQQVEPRQIPKRRYVTHTGTLKLKLSEMREFFQRFQISYTLTTR